MLLFWEWARNSWNASSAVHSCWPMTRPMAWSIVVREVRARSSWLLRSSCSMLRINKASAVAAWAAKVSTWARAAAANTRSVKPYRFNAPTVLAPTVIGIDSEERTPCCRACGRYRGQRVSSRRSGTSMTAPVFSAWRQGPSFAPYCTSSTWEARRSLVATVIGCPLVRAVMPQEAGGTITSAARVASSDMNPSTLDVLSSRVSRAEDAAMRSPDAPVGSWSNVLSPVFIREPLPASRTGFRDRGRHHREFGCMRRDQRPPSA